MSFNLYRKNIYVVSSIIAALSCSVITYSNIKLTEAAEVAQQVKAKELQPAVHNDDFKIIMPLTCKYGEDCFIQDYVDLESAHGQKDYMCGSLSYNAHSGTDFRTIDLKKINRGIDIYAVADGIIVDKTDGYPDDIYAKYLNSHQRPVFPVSDADLQTILGDEFERKNADGSEIDSTIRIRKPCGNGVVIKHGDPNLPIGESYVTEYCHLKKNSIQPNIGDRIKVGTVIGQIGMSGISEFTHIHLGLKYKGKVIDPFTNLSTREGGYNCPFDPNKTVDTSQSFWKKDIKLPYITTKLLSFHITDEKPTALDAEDGNFREDKLTEESKPMYIWANILGPKKDDLLTVTINTDPEFKNYLNNDKKLDRTSKNPKDYLVAKDHDEYFAYIKDKELIKKIKNGKYTATISLLRAGKNILENNPKSTIALTVKKDVIVPESENEKAAVEMKQQ